MIVGYTPAWARRFETERRRIRAAIGPVARAVDHAGSTAVPGLAAKPIVDVLVTVEDAATSRRTSHSYARAGGPVIARILERSGVSEPEGGELERPQP